LKRDIKDLGVFHRRKLLKKSPALNIISGWKKVIALPTVFRSKIAGDGSGLYSELDSSSGCMVSA
jgi:hypothetical protein